MPTYSLPSSFFHKIKIFYQIYLPCLGKLWSGTAAAAMVVSRDSSKTARVVESVRVMEETAIYHPSAALAFGGTDINYHVFQHICIQISARAPLDFYGKDHLYRWMDVRMDGRD